MKRLLLLGGGHSHIEVLRRFGLQPCDGVDITLVSPERHTAYSGMLPGFIAGHYGFHDCHVDLERVAASAGARFLRAEAVAIDPARREVRLAGGDRVHYALLSIDIGSLPPTADIPGAQEGAITVKPVSAFLRKWQALMHAAARSPVRIAVIGGGAAGVEILLSMQRRLAQAAPAAAARFALVSDSPRLLAGHDAAVGAVFARTLRARGIEVHLGSPVVQVQRGTVITGNGQHIAADAAVWATGAAAPRWLRDTGLALAEDGFIAVNAHLQSLTHPEVFAAGDCATIAGMPLPKSGVYAVRQGPLLAANLRHALRGRPLRTYRPQRRTLALISTGDRHAVASYGCCVFAGRWVWRWKDRIDRRFMARYNTLRAKA